ncbi:MAG: HlyD family efflux transporter periplasmic adaptor subunit [Pirellulales bacterium]|nr:HlyD family efflux transporter periplasmic adaptor subunit [Pirellulales bacterium]
MRIKQQIAGIIIASFLSSLATAEQTAPLRTESVVLRPLREAEVPAQQTGLLLKILAAEGKQVQEGQVLAALDAREAKLAVSRARLEHVQANARANNETRVQYAAKSLEVARAELERSQESIEKFAKSISQSQLDVERLTVEKLMLEQKQAEHELKLERFGSQLKQNELESARLRLQQHQLRAPFAGTVALVRGRVGEWVEVGAPVMRLVAVDALRAEGFLPAEHATAE